MFRIIFTGKSLALDGKRAASGASQAEKNGMKKATGKTIAYAAMQVSFFYCTEISKSDTVLGILCPFRAGTMDGCGA